MAKQKTQAGRPQPREAKQSTGLGHRNQCLLPMKKQRDGENTFERGLADRWDSDGMQGKHQGFPVVSGDPGFERTLQDSDF